MTNRYSYRHEKTRNGPRRSRKLWPKTAHAYTLSIPVDWNEHDFEILQRQMMLLDQKFTKMNMVLFHIITLVFQKRETLSTILPGTPLMMLNFVINFHNILVSITTGANMQHQVRDLMEEDQ